MKAEQIKARSLQQLSAARAVNAYQWSKVRLSLEHPEGLVEVQRFEANSKFFRSLVIVAGVLLLVSVILAISGEGEPWRLLALISAVALLLSLWRYVDQRFKATQQAYWFVISLESRKELSATDQALDQKGNRLTHAGGVVYRNEEGDLKYLLVQASGDRTEWVLPKGHIEPGERPRDAAVREVEEETGYWAKVVRWICDQPLTVSGEHQRVRFYLMETAEDKQVVEEREKKKPWPQENRQRDWASLDKAIETATFNESKDLLKKAGELRLKIQEEDKIRQTPRI